MDIIRDSSNKLIDTVGSTTDYVSSKSGELIGTVTDTVGTVAHRVGTTTKYVTERGTEIAGTTTTFVKGNVAKYLPSIIIGSLTLVAGLSWNSAFESLINSYVPAESLKTHNAWFKILYAFILSIIIVIAIAALTYYMPVATVKK